MDIEKEKLRISEAMLVLETKKVALIKEGVGLLRQFVHTTPPASMSNVQPHVYPPPTASTNVSTDCTSPTYETLQNVNLPGMSSFARSLQYNSYP